MNQKKFDRLQNHYLHHFGTEEEPLIFHTLVDEPGTLHVDIMYLKATAKRPFQVLATIGASDYQMPHHPGGKLTRLNEYVTFLPPDWDLNKPENRWVLILLEEVAQFPHGAKKTISYAHTLDFSCQMNELQSKTFNMCGAGLLFPQVIPDVSFLFCKTGLFETVTILHMMPLTRAEMDDIITRREKGHPDWSDMFYPEDDAAYAKLPFLCACKR